MEENILAQKIISNLDLTSLNLADNEQSISILCQKAQTAYGNTAAICVYPHFVTFAKNILKNTNIAILL